MSDSENNPDSSPEPTDEVGTEVEATSTAKAEVATLENMDSDSIASAFADRFGGMEDFGPESVDDLTRQSAYRISVGGSQEFSSIIDGNTFECRVDLNEALLTALSHGSNTSRTTQNEYNIVQGQMRIGADIYAKFDGDFVHVNHIFFSVFKKFLNPKMVGEWDYETFQKFCKNAGFPIEGSYMFNFELLGAHGPAIEKYIPVFTESGAMRVDRQRKPQFIKETFEFPTRNVGLAVTNLEIGGSDPTESRLYGKTYTDEVDGKEVERVYDDPTFIDPFHAQMGNFTRFMRHFKASVALKRQAEDAGEAKQALLDRSKEQRSMATSFLNNFGGVHRGATIGNDGESLLVTPQYYQNRVRCGRFGVKTREDQVVEMNFWQPDPTSAGVAITAADKGGAEAKSPDSDIEELAETTF